MLSQLARLIASITIAAFVSACSTSPPDTFVNLPFAPSMLANVPGKEGQLFTVQEYFKYAISPMDAGREWKKLSENSYAYIVTWKDSLTGKSHKLAMALIVTDRSGGANRPPQLVVAPSRILLDDEELNPYQSVELFQTLHHNFRTQRPPA